MRRFLLSCLLALALADPAAHARELVVDQRARASSDRNPGTQKKPLKTISAAVSKVRAGDRVIIHGGDYREAVVIGASISGTKKAPIVIEAARGETVVIKGSDVISGWKLDHDAIWKAKISRSALRSKDINDLSRELVNEPEQVFVQDGVLLDAIRLRRMPAKDKLQPGGFFYDAINSALYLWLPDSADPNKCKVEVAVRRVLLNIRGSFIIVRGIQMRHASTLAVGPGPGCGLQGEDSLFEDCTITWTDWIGIILSGSRNSLSRCLIACTGNSGINGTGEDHLIEGCRVIYNNMDRYSPSWHCGGAKLIPRFNKGRIIGNEFAYNIGPGLWLDDSCNENRIERNYCHDNEGPGIMVEACAGNLITNNICVANRNSPAADFLSPDPEAEKHGQHNVFVAELINERTQSSLIYQGGGGLGIFISSSPGSRVYNNTCYLNEGGGITVEGPTRQGATVPMSTHDCRIRNNISVYNKGPQLILRKNGIDGNTSGNSSDYNLLLAVGSILAKNGWAAETAFSVADWQRMSNQDQHSREGDPHFAMPTMGDFRLLDDSPALGAGEALSQAKEDSLRHTRPSGTPNIGAAEKAALDYPRSPFQR